MERHALDHGAMSDQLAKPLTGRHVPEIDLLRPALLRGGDDPAIGLDGEAIHVGVDPGLDVANVLPAGRVPEPHQAPARGCQRPAVARVFGPEAPAVVPFQGTRLDIGQGTRLPQLDEVITGCDGQ